MIGVSEKASNFLKALEQLCSEHKIEICASEYDDIELWDLDSNSVFTNINFEDKTKEKTDGKKN